MADLSTNQITHQVIDQTTDQIIDQIFAQTIAQNYKPHFRSNLSPNYRRNFRSDFDQPQYFNRYQYTNKNQGFQSDHPSRSYNTNRFQPKQEFTKPYGFSNSDRKANINFCEKAETPKQQNSENSEQEFNATINVVDFDSKI